MDEDDIDFLEDFIIRRGIRGHARWNAKFFGRNPEKGVDEFNKAGCRTVGYTLFPEYLEQMYFHGGACIIGMFKAFKWIDKHVYGVRIANQ